MPPVLEMTEAEEKAAAEKLAAEEAQALAEFASGFADTPTEVATPSPEDLAKKEAEAKAAKDAEEKIASEKLAADQKAAEQAPKYVQVTEGQLAELLSYNKTIEELRASMESRFGSAFGKMGGLERTLKELHTASTAGETPVVTEADLEKDLEELRPDFPDFTPRLAKSLAKTFGKLKGSKPAINVAAQFDAEAVKPVVTDVLNAKWVQARQKEETEELTEAYADWSAVIGGEKDKTEYRAWLGTQPEPYRKVVEASWRASTVIKSLDKFYQFKDEAAKKAAEVVPPKPPTKAAVDRKAVLAEAVHQRGETGHETGKTAEQEFQEGFSGK